MSCVDRSSVVHSADGTAIGFHTLGAGSPLIVLGGALRAGRDYFQFAQSLSEQFTVHVIDRRGRGLSGPLGPEYSIAQECADLLAVQAATGATRLFGHSYGGLIALQTAARSTVFDRIAVYEPGVSIGNSIPVRWMPTYRRLLDNGKPRAAFAYFIQQSGHAPGPVAKLPLWYLRMVLRIVLRRSRWERFEPLLDANYAEHQQVAALDSSIDLYRSITAELLLLGGSRSPSFTTSQPLKALHDVIPRSTVQILHGLDHNAPDEKAPDRVAAPVAQFLHANGVA